MKVKEQTKKKHDEGVVGIGTLIIFIAMVLVAAVAASVLIQTANRLEIQAMTTGQETTDEVATGIKVEGIAAQKGNTTYGKLTNVTIRVACRAGSNNVDLSQAVVEVSNSTTKILLEYGSGNHFTAPAATGVFATAAFDGTAKQFGLIVLEDEDDSATTTAATPVINRGDHVLFTFSAFTCFHGWAERTDVWGMVIPETGATGIFAFRTPASYTDSVYELY